MPMKAVMPPIDTDILEQELILAQFIRETNKGNNQIYVFSAHQCPNLMKEVGRVREMSFRIGGGGTGGECDTDEFDYMDKPYKQLVVWSPVEKEIVGGYRFIMGRDMKLLPDGQPDIVTSHMFRFSEKFLKEYLPNTIDLGRAFIHPDYQSTTTRPKSIFAFDNLWDGLLVLPYFEPEIRYAIGKMTIYPKYDERCRTAIFYFLSHFLGDKDDLLTLKEPFFDKTTAVDEEIAAIFEEGDAVENNYNRLCQFVRGCGVSVPPLINSYYRLSSKMRVFGTGVNTEFGNIFDTGSMIDVQEINPDKVARHIDSFLEKNPQFA